MKELPIHAVLFLLALGFLTWKALSFIHPQNQHTLRSVAILVLGDIGRSPRMMYHAKSFAENNFETDLIGYHGVFPSQVLSHLALISLRVHVLGSKPIPALERLPKLRLRYLPDSPTAFRRLPFILAGPLKVLHQIFAILIVLVFLIRVPPEFILVQVRPTYQGHHKLLKKGLTESSKRTDFTHRPVCCKDPRV